MPPPTTTSLYTTPNIVLASGIVAWIIFIIALVFMKHEKYRGGYDQDQINEAIIEKQKLQIKFLENKNTTMKKNINDILKDSEDVMTEVKRSNTFLSEENRKSGGYSNKKSMGQLLVTELLVSALVNKIKEAADPKAMRGLIPDVDQIMRELKMIKALLATENEKAGKSMGQLLLVENQFLAVEGLLSTVNNKLKTNGASGVIQEDFNLIFIELKVLQAELKVLATEYEKAGNSIGGQLFVVDGLLSTVINKLKKDASIKINAMGFPERSGYTASTVAKEAQARRNVQQMVVGSNAETHNMYY